MSSFRSIRKKIQRLNDENSLMIRQSSAILKHGSELGENMQAVYADLVRRIEENKQTILECEEQIQGALEK
jgi:hypothetical protein